MLDLSDVGYECTEELPWAHGGCSIIGWCYFLGKCMYVHLIQTHGQPECCVTVEGMKFAYFQLRAALMRHMAVLMLYFASCLLNYLSHGQDLTACDIK